MRIGIMQPYFFPYVGYFDLINRTDKWIIFDTPQYIRHGWVNRNRVLHPKRGWQYVIAPIKRHRRDTPIEQIEVAEQFPWRQRIVGQLNHYKKSAPHFDATVAFVQDCLDEPETHLARINGRILSQTCDLLGIEYDYEYFSKMNLALGPVDSPGDWALQISAAVGATEYINPPGGEHLFDRTRFAQRGIQLTIQPSIDFRYECGPYAFEPHLSVIDALMWNRPAEIKRYLDSLVTA